jgi:DNA-binding transcriptional LysR family regulator
MEIFVGVVEAGQITRAAEVLKLSKSAVSHGLSDLEKYLGLQLLSRNNRALQLTEAGQSYYEDCKRILSDVGAAEDQVRQTENQVSGNIRLTAPDSFGSYLLTPIFAAFMEENPGITLDLNLTERQVDLVEEGYDLAFRISPAHDEKHITQKLSSVHMVTCASPAYLKQHGSPATIKDLKHHNCLLYVRSPVWHLVKDGRVHEFMPEGNIRTNSGENLRQFAVAGVGIIHLPYFLAYHALAKGRLVEVLPDYQSRRLDGYIVRPAHKHCPARVHSLMEYTINQANNITALMQSFDRTV